jgi:type I restriction enzyme S subunit
MREDWIECKFDDVFFTTSGGTPSRRNENYYIGNIPWIKSGELKSNIITEAEEFISEAAVKNSSAKVFPVGTILLALYGATIGKIAILGIPAATNQAICGIFETPFVFSKYAYYYLVNKKSYLIKQGIGGAQPNISQTILKNLDFSLPPLPEQRAIVKKLESLFSSLDAGVAELKKAQQQLKIYRQAVLKKAFEGEMTKEGNDNFIETKINDICANLSNDMNIVKLGSLITLQGGYAFKSQEFQTEGIPVVKIANVNLDNINWDETSYIDKDRVNEFKSYALKEGDVLIAMTRPVIKSLNSVKTVIVRNSDLPCFLNQRVGRFLIKDGSVLKEYLQYFIKSTFFKDPIVRQANDSLLPNISGKIIENFDFIIPNSIDEQKAIVKQLESRLSVCDSIEKSIKESLEKAEALRQSLLKKAFEGNLLTAQELVECKQAADYEPASVLLERIKAEQNISTAKPAQKKVAQPLVVAEVATTVTKISADIHAGLIAKVIKIHEENPASIDNLSHIKCEKIAHLVEYHLQIPLGRQPVKDAAGPDDYSHLKKIEHRAKMANYFAIQKKDIGYSYSTAKNSDKAIEKFQSALSDEKNKQLDDLIALFLKFDLEVSEIIATTYAGWNNMILNGNTNPSDEEIVYESRENWSERKLKIERERFFKAIEWMRKNEIVPTGYGAVVPFPKKKK